MTLSNNIFHKDKLSKGLLTLILFLNLFSFSGFAVNSQAQQTKIVKTELLFLSTSQKVKQSITYKKALASIFNFTNFRALNLKAILKHNRLTKIKFEHLSKQNFIVLLSAKIFQNKIIPQIPEEDMSVYTG